MCFENDLVYLDACRNMYSDSGEKPKKYKNDGR